MARITSRIEEQTEGGFASMIDIVFLLLVYFVVQPFKAPELRLESHLPKQSGPSAVRDRPPVPSIMLDVLDAAPDGAVFRIGGSSFEDGTTIAARLYRESGGDRSIPVTVAPTVRVPFRFVMQALDQCSLAEMTQVSFADPR